MNRRDFLKSAGLAALGTTLSAPLLRPGGLRAADDAPYYDPDYFEAAERFAFLSPQEAVLSLALRPARTMDIKLYRGQTPTGLTSGTATTYRGVSDVLDIFLAGFFWGPEFYYRLEYRDSGVSSAWRTTPTRRVRTPQSYLDRGRLEVLLLSDDHTYDDADMGDRIVHDPKLRSARLSGEYVNDFLRILRHEPLYLPPDDSEEAKVMSGYSLAQFINLVLTREDPDLMFILGDSTGIGAGYKWSGLGLKDPSEATAEDTDAISRLLWLRMRRMYSALTPWLPVYLVLGNHDGESGYDGARPWALKYRNRFWRQPGSLQGFSENENYYCLPWGAGSGGEAPLFIVLDNESYNPLPGPLRPEDWTLGGAQKSWLNRVLAIDSPWKFSFFHHVLGGWPRGTNESITSYAYGRGPLFTADDYAPYVPNPEAVEQVALTRMMRQAGVRASFYGHDHIHFLRRVEGDFHGACVGSPKPVGELTWYKGPLWKKFYGCYGFDQREEARSCYPTDFWGPSGYAKLTLTPSSALLEYKRAAFNQPHTNLPPDKGPGDLISTARL